ncbi:MAG: hypothetical protein LBC20_16065, partial [Planctomycetaceae bacterium]|nr:hypothetical protein [Planctomycetaceae bacterium]
MLFPKNRKTRLPPFPTPLISPTEGYPIFWLKKPKNVTFAKKERNMVATKETGRGKILVTGGTGYIGSHT